MRGIADKTIDVSPAIDINPYSILIRPDKLVSTASQIEKPASDIRQNHPDTL